MPPGRKAGEDRLVELHRIVAAEMLPGLRLRLEFEDGFRGIASLAGLVQAGGVLTAISDKPTEFTVANNGRTVAWKHADGEDVDLCADALRRLAEDAVARAAE
jgi:hypothetical protein